jgi:methylenetetrahydrofolate dehydrogenase (NADP+) / methenyltetrahydrofolate cyclohydrolase
VCYAFRMTARILDGTKIRDEIFAELKEEVAQLAAPGVRPGLAAVLVGENPASQLYVKSKIAACKHLGLASWLHTPPASVTTEQMLQVVDDLNRDDNVDGILVQLPLPPQVDSKRVLEAVLPSKDVDGFHPVSMGMLVSNRPGLVACTPAGCMEILRRNGIGIEGANAVVLGRSDIVGKPMAHLLLQANATVTVCHTRTRDLAEHTLAADVLIVAAGRAGLVSAEMVRDGAVVVDVGMNRGEDGLVGDVDPAAAHRASLMTPVPGGVGPMTIACLLENAVRCARYRRGDLDYPG